MLKTKNPALRTAIAASLVGGLTACSGSSSSGGGTGETPPAGQETTGQFVDSPVGGMEYTRSDKGGEVFLTNDNGEFTYAENGSVTFRIGQLTIGSANGKPVLSPKDIASGDGVSNVARVLQTLDDDGNPANGITISAQVRSKAAKATTPRNIAETTDLDSIADEITELSDDERTLVTKDKALAHLDETLASIEGADITSCSNSQAKDLDQSDFNGLTLGSVTNNETLLTQFRSDGTFTEYNSGDDPEVGAVTWNGTWEFDLSSQRLSLDFVNEYEEQDGDEFRICSAGSRLIAEAEDGPESLYKLNKTISGSRGAGTYLLKFPDELGAVLTLDENGNLDYFEGESPTDASVSYNDGGATINWSAEDNDELYFLAGQATRTAIYLDFSETGGGFERIGVAKSTAPITNFKPTAQDLEGKALLFHSHDYNEVVTFELKADGTYTSFYNDSYENGVRQDAERREHDWSITDGVLHLDEEGGTQERWRTALAKTTTYWALQNDENTNEINKIDSVSLSKPLTEASLVGTYDISIPTEDNAREVLTLSEGGSCDYSGTGCNWTIEGKDKGVITFGSGDARGNIWQMANRSNGYIFVMTHDNNPDDIEPGYMTRR